MQDFITVATFVFPSEMAVAKGKLESEGITCRVLDELTVQSYNFISNAVGGVKLQVSNADFERARAILLEGGFLTDTESEPSNIEKALSNPSTRKKIKVALYGFTLFIVIFCISMIVYSHKNAPTIQEKLVFGDWCLEYIIYGEDEFTPNTTSSDTSLHPLFTFNSDYFCNDKIVFDRNGKVIIPGFDTPEITGQWRFVGDSLSISNVDTLDFVFDYNYEIEFKNNYLLLKSDYTYLICHLSK